MKKMYNISANILYQAISVISAIAATILYLRFIYILGKYWGFLIEEEEEILCPVFVLVFSGIMLIIIAYLLESLSIGLYSLYYFKFFGTILFLIAGIGLNSGTSHYRKDIATLEEKYLSYLEKQRHKSSNRISPEENKKYEENPVINIIKESNSKIISVYLRGYISKPEIMRFFECKDDYNTVYLLGPTHPLQIKDNTPKIWFSPFSETKGDFITVSSSNITSFITLISTTLKKNPKTVFIGDFIETLFENESSKSIFNFLSILSNYIRQSESRLIIVVSKDITDNKNRALCKNISDLIVEIDSMVKDNKLFYNIVIYSLIHLKKYKYILDNKLRVLSEQA